MKEIYKNHRSRMKSLKHLITVNQCTEIEIPWIKIVWNSAAIVHSMRQQCHTIIYCQSVFQFIDVLLDGGNLGWNYCLWLCEWVCFFVTHNILSLHLATNTMVWPCEGILVRINFQHIKPENILFFCIESRHSLRSSCISESHTV